MNIHLTRFENAIFEVLEASVGEAVPRMVLEAALVKVRPFNNIPSENSNVLEVLIRRIRCKLSTGSTIETVRGVGYKLKVVALCDSCQQHPGTHQVLVGFEKLQTLVCDNCSPYKAA